MVKLGPWQDQTQDDEAYLLREVRFRILASVTTGSCRSGVRDLCGEGLWATVREKGWAESSKELWPPPASSLAGSKSEELAGDAEDAVDAIQSGLICCWCPWTCWNCSARVCCVGSACAGRRELRSWCLGGVWTPSSCSRPPSLCSGILNWRSYVWEWQKRETTSGYYVQTTITKQLYIATIAAWIGQLHDNDNVIMKPWLIVFCIYDGDKMMHRSTFLLVASFCQKISNQWPAALWYGILVFYCKTEAFNTFVCMSTMPQNKDLFTEQLNSCGKDVSCCESWGMETGVSFSTQH